MGVCVLAIPIALLLALIALLFGSIKAADQVAQQRYALQYWHYAQQQTYAQQQGGYAYPQQPPANQSPPTPPPPDSGNPGDPPAKG
jgi:hypothetical protein